MSNDRLCGNSDLGLLDLTDAEAKNEYLRDLDAELEPQGFSRRRKESQWRRRWNESNDLWVHINFGKDVVNPSVGVNYLDLTTLLTKDVAPVTGVMTMLRTIVPASHIYTIEEGSAWVVHDLQNFGLPFLSRLTDRPFVIEKLKSTGVADWPTISYSHRIRLLPLLVASQGDTDEACRLLHQFGLESADRDQIVPGYDVFAAAFSERFAC